MRHGVGFRGQLWKVRTELLGTHSATPAAQRPLDTGRVRLRQRLRLRHSKSQNDANGSESPAGAVSIATLLRNAQHHGGKLPTPRSLSPVTPH